MEGFEPIYNKNSKILILGSFPSVVSRKNNFYYGNPQNKFWKMMEMFFSVKFFNVEDKIDFVLSHNFALWDIVESCTISGSLDKDIKDVKFVDLKKVLPPHTNVKKILCNGKKSFELTQKYLTKNNLNFNVVCMPSTSSANTRFNFEIWERELKEN